MTSPSTGRIGPNSTRDAVGSRRNEGRTAHHSVGVPGLHHHITQRGNRQQQTFFCDEDYQSSEEAMRISRAHEQSGRQPLSRWHQVSRFIKVVIQNPGVVDQCGRGGDKIVYWPTAVLDDRDVRESPV